MVKAWWMRYYALGGVVSKHPPVAMTLVGQTQRQVGGSARWGMVNLDSDQWIYHPNLV